MKDETCQKCGGGGIIQRHPFINRCDCGASRVDYYTSRHGKMIAKDSDGFDVDEATGTADDFHPLLPTCESRRASEAQTP